MLDEESHSQPQHQSPHELITQPIEVIMYIATAHPIATMWKPAMLLFATCKRMSQYQTPYFKYIGAPIEFADQLMSYVRVLLSQCILYNMPVILPNATKFIDSVTDKSSSNQLLEVIALYQFERNINSFEHTKMTILSCISCDVVENAMSESEKLTLENIVRVDLLCMIRECLRNYIRCDNYGMKYFVVYNRISDIFHTIDHTNEYDISILAKYIIHSVNNIFRLCGVSRELTVTGHIIKRICGCCERLICDCSPVSGSFISNEIAAGGNMTDWFSIEVEIAHKIT